MKISTATILAGQAPVRSRVSRSAIEGLFFHFGGFVVAYIVLCLRIFVAIMGSQTERSNDFHF
jgi:hypothetical protein